MVQYLQCVWHIGSSYVCVCVCVCTQLSSGFRLISESMRLFPCLEEFLPTKKSFTTCLIYCIRDDLPHRIPDEVSCDLPFTGQLGKTGTLSISCVDVSKSFSLHCGNPESCSMRMNTHTAHNTGEE